MANKIREFRIEKGWTVDELADVTGLSQGYLSKLESGKRGKRGLTSTTAEKLAMAFGKEPAEVMGIAGGTNSVGARQAAAAKGMHEDDAEPYEAQDDDLLREFVKKRKNVMPYTIKSDSLDQAGIHKGDVVFLDISVEAVENVQALDAVLAQQYFHTEVPGGQSLAMNKTRTLLRQFVPPNLLITNSSDDNEPIINTDNEAVAIRGVIIGKHQSFKKIRK